MSVVAVTRALISVSDKRDLIPFATRLAAAGVQLVSSGGTASALRQGGIPVTAVSDVTGFPEILGGRVKTLHPMIHAGILAAGDDPAHAADLAEHGVERFQLVVVNLYPFEATVADPQVTADEAIEQIDIGGPAMVRAAAKNHDWVGIVTSPDQYVEVGDAIVSGGLDDDLRHRLARDAFFHTAAYDAAIVGWMGRDEDLPERMVLPMQRAQELRYGENPHQPAALYSVPAESGWWSSAMIHQGKAMSFNNYADTEAAWRLAGEFSGPAAVIVKHTNACGVAVAAGQPEALVKAWECDPLSAFGGVVALNEELEAATAGLLAERFVEVVIAPALADEAAGILVARPNLRVVTAPLPGVSNLDLRRIEGGLLAQRRDVIELSGDALPDSWEVKAGELAPSVVRDLRLAWVVAGHTKSNAIVVAAEGAAVGVGAGDQSRVGAAHRALDRAGARAKGAVAASDAFLPFRDTLDLLADAGVVALVEPGGSRRDDEVIEAASEHGVALVFTNRRHFRH